jgi:hypothetical protein
VKKLHRISLRLADEDMQFLTEMAARLKLPTDGRPILSRAVQQVLAFMRTSMGTAMPSGQGKQCLTAGGAA